MAIVTQVMRISLTKRVATIRRVSSHPPQGNQVAKLGNLVQVVPLSMISIQDI